MEQIWIWNGSYQNAGNWKETILFSEPRHMHELNTTSKGNTNFTNAIRGMSSNTRSYLDIKIKRNMDELWEQECYFFSSFYDV